jgi:hypothetical protein
MHVTKEEPMRKLLSLLSAMSLGFALTAQADEPASLGDVFPAPGAGSPVFTVERSWKGTDQNRVFFERYTDRDCKFVAAVDATYDSGRLSAARYEQGQTGETAVVEIKDGKVFYSCTQDGKTKRSTENDSGDLVPFCAVPNVITAKWVDLRAGKPAEFKIPIHMRREAYTFKLTKERIWSQRDRTFTEFKLEPANPVFRALSDPFYYVFDDQGKTLIEYRGMTITKSGTPGKLKDFQARVVYRPAADSRK